MHWSQGQGSWHGDTWALCTKTGTLIQWYPCTVHKDKEPNTVVSVHCTQGQGPWIQSLPCIAHKDNALNAATPCQCFSCFLCPLLVSQLIVLLACVSIGVFPNFPTPRWYLSAATNNLHLCLCSSPPRVPKALPQLLVCLVPQPLSLVGCCVAQWVKSLCLWSEGCPFQPWHQQNSHTSVGPYT